MLKWYISNLQRDYYYNMDFKLNSYVINLNQRHYYHNVPLSCFPLFLAFLIFICCYLLISYFHNFYFKDFHYLWIFELISKETIQINSPYFSLGFIFECLFFCIFGWFFEIINESTFQGMHTKIVQKLLKFGFMLFIITEIMFFFGFFWAYFYLSLSPAIELGCIWVPIGINPINPFNLPFLNTLLLLTSGIFITICHIFLCLGYFSLSSLYFCFTLSFGFIFTLIQINEYINASFSISDSVYGAIFYLLTGFHGFHVLIGSIFISICWLRLNLGHFTKTHHIGFESATWYWHFVDIVWLFLFLIVYIWGYL